MSNGLWLKTALVNANEVIPKRRIILSEVGSCILKRGAQLLKRMKSAL